MGANGQANLLGDEGRFLIDDSGRLSICEKCCCDCASLAGTYTAAFPAWANCTDCDESVMTGNVPLGKYTDCWYEENRWAGEYMVKAVLIWCPMWCGPFGYPVGSHWLLYVECWDFTPEIGVNITLLWSGTKAGCETPVGTYTRSGGCDLTPAVQVS